MLCQICAASLIGYAEQVLEELVVNSIMLVCAVLASLAAGVLAAYGVCVSMFELFRIHAKQVRTARAPIQTARVAEG